MQQATVICIASPKKVRGSDLYVALENKLDNYFNGEELGITQKWVELNIIEQNIESKIIIGLAGK